MDPARHRTALARSRLSRPLRLALIDQILTPEHSVFDYGCGRGDDLRQLTHTGYTATGWDPNFRPSTPQQPADLVNLGYVINVIENPLERRQALQSAWQLARQVLVVAARLGDEKDITKLTPFADGWLTGRNTFQKFYDQVELRNYINSTLQVESVAAGPGVFYVFRDEAVKQGFLAARIRRRPAGIPRRRISDELFEAHRSLLEPLMAFFTDRGRLPEEEELPDQTADLCAAFGSVRRAFRTILTVTGEAEWNETRRRRREDLMIYVGLSQFGGRPRYGQLPPDLQRDVRAFFSSYKEACAQADRLLFAAGSMERINLACRAAEVGKLMPSALYVHESALPNLPPLLRVYEGCANRFIGSVEGANIIKLSREEPRVSYLSYPDFDRDPHPALASSVVVPLQTFWVQYRDYTRETNPPILHRKEEFVAQDYPARAKFHTLTVAEEAEGLLAGPTPGRRSEWSTWMVQHQLAFRGHRLVKLRP